MILSLSWFLSSSLLILIVILMRWILRNRISPILRYAIWLLVLARLLLPVNLASSTISAANIPDLIRNAGLQNGSVLSGNDGAYASSPFPAVSGTPGAAADSSDTAENLQTGIPKQKLFFIVWLSGSVAVAVWFTAVNLYYVSKLKHSRTLIVTENSRLPVYLSQELQSPCLVGLFHPQIYVTADVARNSIMLRHTVAHELTHYYHGDHVWSLLRCFCLALHWYHPLVWLAAALSKTDAELACDASVLKMLGSDARASYGQTIIETSRSARSPLPSLSAGKKDLGRRIRSIAHEPKTTAVALAVLIPVLILTVGCTFTGKVSSTSEPQGKSMETAASADIAGETVPDHMTASGSENQGSIVEYKYTDGPESLVFGIAPYLKVNTSDHTFEFCPSVLSDYIAVGYYQQTSEQIILTANDESSHQYSFYINSAGDLVFDKNNSSIIPQYDYKGEIGTVCPVSDHAVFQKT